MARTYQQMLDDIDAQIAALEVTAEEVEYPGAGRLRNSRLDLLYAERRRLKPLAEREARGGGMRIRGGTPV